MPSTTPTRTTVPASSFSATRCAVVAPTLPAPTTVILLTMEIRCDEMGCDDVNLPSQKLDGPVSGFNVLNPRVCASRDGDRVADARGPRAPRDLEARPAVRRRDRAARSRWT